MHYFSRNYEGAVSRVIFSIKESRTASKIEAFYLVCTGRTLNTHETSYVLSTYVLCQEVKPKISYNFDFNR